MPVEVRIVGVSTKGGRVNEAGVTALGQVVIGTVAYDETEFNELATINTAFNFYQPKSGQQFVITAILAYGDKQVSTSTNATVIIYEAVTDVTITVSKVLLQFEIGQNQSLPFSPLNLLVAEGVFINAKTDDDDIHMTIMGYYIPVLPS